MGQIERGQRGAVFEHTAHMFHLGGVEMRKVERGQRGAVFEHAIHIFHH